MFKNALQTAFAIFAVFMGYRVTAGLLKKAAPTAATTTNTGQGA